MKGEEYYRLQRDLDTVKILIMELKAGNNQTGA